MTHFYVGLDLGQKKDYTAIAVVERQEPELGRDGHLWWMRQPEELEARLAVRHLERVALGTSYVSIVARVREMVHSVELRGRCTLVVDGTGVGGAVVDLLREADLDCELVAVTITGGGSARSRGGFWNVPKRELVGVVQVLLEQERLVFAAGMERAGTLVDEFLAMRVRVTAGGGEQFGAWREGTHDDLALAVAMACWRGKGEERGVGERGDGRLL